MEQGRRPRWAWTRAGWGAPIHKDPWWLSWFSPAVGNLRPQGQQPLHHPQTLTLSMLAREAPRRQGIHRVKAEEDKNSRR